MVGNLRRRDVDTAVNSQVKMNSLTDRHNDAAISNTMGFEMGDDDRLKEECGVVGIYAPNREAARLCFFSLFALQHRGQESAGIAVSDSNKVRWHKDMGLISQVFNEETLASMPGEMAVGHTRYSTTGASVLRNAQPVYCQSLVGEIAVAHNGNLINTATLRQELEAEGEVFDTTSDSELIARILVRFLHDGPEIAVSEVMRRCEGAFSVTVLTPRMIIGFRDPNGVRPLVAASLPDGGYMLASESCALTPVDGKVVREIEPGEMAIIDHSGLRFSDGHTHRKRSMCLFEFIYFARPDSHMYGTSLYLARQRMGANLALEHPTEADIVVPVPDSGIPAALGYANASGIPFCEGMMKSRYIHRTFIAPDQRLRELGVKMKLSVLEENIKGKRLVLVDDSIVRGTTTRQIVKLLFDTGAREVHVRITAPPIKFPCFYGIDMASKGELAAAVMSIKDLESHLGATSLGFLSIEGAVSAVGAPQGDFCLACFNGDYPIPIPQSLVKHAYESPPEVGEMAGVTHGQIPLLTDV